MLLHTFRVPRKRKVKKFRAVTAVKEMARERIADPVRRLTRATRRIASGDFDARIAHNLDEVRIRRAGR